MADPIGRAADRARPSPAASPTRPEDAELVAVIGTMPMSTLAGFGGMSLDHDTLDKLVERWRDRAGRLDAGSEARR